MKTFISYRFTGEDPERLRPLLSSVRDALMSHQHEVHCTFFDQQRFEDEKKSAGGILTEAFEKINSCNYLFVVVTSDAKSEGMLMEVGYCLAKGIPIALAVMCGVSKTTLPEFAERVIRFTDLPDLQNKINALDFDFC